MWGAGAKPRPPEALCRNAFSTSAHCAMWRSLWQQIGLSTVCAPCPSDRGRFRVLKKSLPKQKRVKGEALVGCRGKASARRRPCFATLSAQAPVAQCGTACGSKLVCQQSAPPVRRTGGASVWLGLHRVRLIKPACGDPLFLSQRYPGGGSRSGKVKTKSGRESGKGLEAGKYHPRQSGVFRGVNGCQTGINVITSTR